VLASLHHRVGLCDAEVDTRGVDCALALGGGLVFAGQFEVLLEEGDGFLDKPFLVVQET